MKNASILDRGGLGEVSTNSIMDTNKRRRRHRSWPEALKREIVAATLTPGSVVARRYDVNANQGFAWRRRYRDGSMQPAELQLVPVTVMPDQPVATAPAGPSELIEIVLIDYRVRVGDGIKATTLRLVLDVLERR